MAFPIRARLASISRLHRPLLDLTQLQEKSRDGVAIPFHGNHRQNGPDPNLADPPDEEPSKRQE
jgi:hypothetical protein